MPSLQAACAESGLQPSDPFLAKAIQLYETTVVRHGLMLVGPTMSGKTSCWRTLAKAMTALNAAGDPAFEKVWFVVANGTRSKELVCWRSSAWQEPHMSTLPEQQPLKHVG